MVIYVFHISPLYQTGFEYLLYIFFHLVQSIYFQLLPDYNWDKSYLHSKINQVLSLQTDFLLQDLFLSNRYKFELYQSSFQ